MKRFLSLIGFVLIAGCGTAEEPVEKTKVETQQVATASSVESTKIDEEEIKEVVKIPTQRTVSENHPWQGANSSIKKWQSEGETVFLWSDAENVEKRILDVAGVDPNAEGFVNSPNNYTKEKMASTTAENLGLFIKEVSQYVDNEAYFNKLEEVKQAMLNGEYDSVPNLIEEAKSLRESE